jgi:hypothetical protein
LHKHHANHSNSDEPKSFLSSKNTASALAERAKPDPSLPHSVLLLSGYDIAEAEKRRGKGGGVEIEKERDGGMTRRNISRNICCICIGLALERISPETANYNIIKMKFKFYRSRL